VKAMCRIRSEDLKNPDILFLILELLDDNEAINVPEDIPVQDQIISSMFKAPCGPAEFLSPEAPVEGPRYSRISELAEYTLEKKLPGNKKTVAVVLRALKNADFQCRNWLDKNFFRFSWPDPYSVYIHFVQAVHATGHFFLYHSIIQAKKEMRGWIIRFAASQNPPVSRVFSVLINEETSPVLDACMELKTPVVELLPVLADFVTDKRVRLIMTRWNENGLREAVLYKALYDPGAYRDVGIYLSSGANVDRDIAADIFLRVTKKDPFPADFPLAGLLKYVDVDVVLRYMTERIPHIVRKACIVTLLDIIKDTGQRYNLLKYFGCLGGLKESKKLENEFWLLLRKKYTGLLLPSDYNHPFILFADPGIQPSRYRKEIIAFLGDNLIQITLLLRAMPSFIPKDDEVPVIRKAIEREVKRIKASWERDKRERIDHPEQYKYDDKKAPQCCLMNLDHYWDGLQKLAEKMGMKNTVNDISSLLQIDWIKVLHDLVSGNGKAE